MNFLCEPEFFGSPLTCSAEEETEWHSGYCCPFASTDPHGCCEDCVCSAALCLNPCWVRMYKFDDEREPWSLAKTTLCFPVGVLTWCPQSVPCLGQVINVDPNPHCTAEVINRYLGTKDSRCCGGESRSTCFAQTAWCCCPVGLGAGRVYRELRVREKRQHPECVGCCLPLFIGCVCFPCVGDCQHKERRLGGGMHEWRARMDRSLADLDAALKRRSESDDEDQEMINTLTAAMEHLDHATAEQPPAWCEWCIKDEASQPSPSSQQLPLARQISSTWADEDAVWVNLNFLGLEVATRRVKLPRSAPISSLGHQIKSVAVWPYDLSEDASVCLSLGGEELDGASTLGDNGVEQDAAICVKMAAAAQPVELA